MCDLCGLSVWSWECPHFPGKSYIITDTEEEGEGEERIVTATYTIYDARLAEVSVVFDGATPDAQILRKAQDLFTRKKLDNETQQFLNKSYNIRLNQGKLIFDKNRKIKQEGPKMDLETRIEEQETELKDLRESNESLRERAEQTESLRAENEKLKERNEALEASNKDKEGLIGDLRSDKRQLKEQVTTLESFEEDANKYRKVKEQRAEAAIESWSAAEKLKEREITEEEIEKKKRSLINMESLEEIDEQKELYDERVEARQEKFTKPELPNIESEKDESNKETSDEDDVVYI